MKLYVVRQRDDKQAVGFFWVEDKNELMDMVDEATDVARCEYQEIESSGGFMWSDHAPGLGIHREYTESADGPGDQEIAALCSDIEPMGSIESYFYDDRSEQETWELLDPKGYAAMQGRRAAEERAEREANEPPTDKVYFIGCDGHVKIGITGGKVQKRMNAIATAHYSEMTLLAVIEGVHGSLEMELHRRFAQHRVRGEWFKLCPEIEAFLDKVRAGTWREDK